jgi:hypothetical protein
MSFDVRRTQLVTRSVRKAQMPICSREANHDEHRPFDLDPRKGSSSPGQDKPMSRGRRKDEGRRIGNLRGEDRRFEQNVFEAWICTAF